MRSNLTRSLACRYAILRDGNLHIGEQVVMDAQIVERCAWCAVARLRAGGGVLVSVGVVERVRELIGEKVT